MTSIAFASERTVGYLAAEVVRLEAPVALQAVVGVVALEVEHRVDPTLCVSEPVLAPTTTILRPSVSCGQSLDLLLAHVFDVEALAGESGEVDALHAAAVHDEVGVALGQLLVVDDLGLLKAHRDGQLERRPAGGQRVGHRQREAHLHEPVSEMVGVWPDRLRSGSLGIAGLVHQLGDRIEVGLIGGDDPLDAPPVIDVATDIAEGGLLDRLEESDLGDSLEQLARPWRAPAGRASG